MRRNSLHAASRREGILIQKSEIDGLLLSGKELSCHKRRGSHMSIGLRDIHIGHEWKNVRQSICKGIA